MSTIKIDLSRGVDVFRGRRLLKHFEGENAYEAAWAYAALKPGRWIRYWAEKEA